MVSSYTVFKFLHVVSAIVWVGGGVMMQALAFRARRAGPTDVVGYAQQAAWAGNRLFMPASFATLIFGLAVVGAGHFTFSTTWIWLGLVGFALTAINGGAVLGRLSRQLADVGTERGPNDPAVQAIAGRLVRAMRFDLVVVLLVVADMVFKPTL